MKILLVEDDPKLSTLMTENMRVQGWAVETATNGQDTLSRLSSLPDIQLIVLDRLLGLEDSKNFLPQIREQHPQLPILVLSAVSTPQERTDLLNLGADDYLGKPFSFQELQARIRALTRRSAQPHRSYIQIGNLVLDTNKRVATVNGQNIVLPAKEYLVLHTLSQEKGRVWNKLDLLDYVWGQNSNAETNVVEATMTNLRKKLTELGCSVEIKNSRNLGYWIEG